MTSTSLTKDVAAADGGPACVRSFRGSGARAYGPGTALAGWGAPGRRRAPARGVDVKPRAEEGPGGPKTAKNPRKGG